MGKTIVKLPCYISELCGQNPIERMCIRQRVSPASHNLNSKSLKMGPLVNLNKQKGTDKLRMPSIDMAKISNIEKEYTQLIRQNQESERQSVKKDEMRESKLLLLKNITPVPQSKKSNQNLLSSLVQYSKNPSKQRICSIPAANISMSPAKRNVEVRVRKDNDILSQYKNGTALKEVDFVKMFIIEQLLDYLSRTSERMKDEMVSFCRFYIDNICVQNYRLISGMLLRSKDYLTAVFYQKIGFYIFLILGTDAELKQEAHFLIKSLTQYIHKNNLIILDLLMEMIDIERIQGLSCQFHVYNTSRFNEDRRKINHNEDRMGLVANNNASLISIIKSILFNCGFDSLKTFVMDILTNQETDLLQKIKEIIMMLMSLDSILSNSITRQPEKPQPPFLPPSTASTPYTLVLDMDQTLIHYKQDNEQNQSQLLIRPYCKQFLAEMHNHFQIVVFTAALKQYADHILDTIDPQGLISHRLYRQHTSIQDYISIKDLSLINRQLSKTIIVDNIASNFKLQPRNGITISTWVGTQDDNSLQNLMPVLKKLVVQKVKDVRDGLQILSQQMQKMIQNGDQINFDKVSLQGI